MTRRWHNYGPGDMTAVGMIQLAEVAPAAQELARVDGRPLIALIITPHDHTPDPVKQPFLASWDVAALLHGQLDAWADSLPIDVHDRYATVRRQVLEQAAQSLQEGTDQ